MLEVSQPDQNNNFCRVDYRRTLPQQSGRQIAVLCATPKFTRALLSCLLLLISFLSVANAQPLDFIGRRWEIDERIPPAPSASFPLFKGRIDFQWEGIKVFIPPQVDELQPSAAARGARAGNSLCLQPRFNAALEESHRLQAVFGIPLADLKARTKNNTWYRITITCSSGNLPAPLYQLLFNGSDTLLAVHSGILFRLRALAPNGTTVGGTTVGGTTVEGTTVEGTTAQQPSSAVIAAANLGNASQGNTTEGNTGQVKDQKGAVTSSGGTFTAPHHGVPNDTRPAVAAADSVRARLDPERYPPAQGFTDTEVEAAQRAPQGAQQQLPAQQRTSLVPRAIETQLRLQSEIEPEELVEFLADIQHTVETDNRRALSNRIRYPLYVALPEEPLTIRSPREFLFNYDRVMTETVKNTILHVDSKDLIPTRRGVLLGNGVIVSRECPKTPCGWNALKLSGLG